MGFDEKSRMARVARRSIWVEGALSGAGLEHTRGFVAAVVLMRKIEELPDQDSAVS